MERGTTGTRAAMCLLLAGLTGGPVLRLTQGSFLDMISESQFYVLNEGESVVLECSFHADHYNLFEHPVFWRKEQHGEDLAVNILSNINEPFVATNRFDVNYVPAEPRYQLELSIKDVVREDSGNYTCEVRGAHSVALAQVMHYLFVRAPVESVCLTTDPSPIYGTRTPVTLRLTEGHPFTLRCLSSGGYPPPTVSIYVDRRDVTAEFSSSTSVRLSGTKGLRLIKYLVERKTTSFVPRANDDGVTVKCVVSVQGLNAHVESTMLDVHFSPKITCSPIEAYADQVSVDIKCAIKAKPKPTSVFWILTNNGTTLAPGEVIDDFWATTRDLDPGVFEVILSMSQVGPEKFRKYTIVAENSVAISRRDVDLIQVVKSSARQPLSDDASSHSSERVAPRDMIQRGPKTTKNSAPHVQLRNDGARQVSLDCISALLVFFQCSIRLFQPLIRVTDRLYRTLLSSSEL